MLSRRGFISCSAALGAASLAGCAAQPSALARLQNDTALLIAGLQSVLPALAALPPSVVPASTVASLRTNIEEASMFASDIESAQSEAQTTTPLQSMAEAVNSAVQTAAPLHLPPHLRSVFAAADSLMPALAMPAGDRVAVAAYSADQARLVLRLSISKPA
jgi:hypothetical protein